MLSLNSQKAAISILLVALSGVFGCFSGNFENGSEDSKTDLLRPDVYPQFRLEPSHQGISPPNTAISPVLDLDWKSNALALGNYSASKSSPSVDVDTLYIGVDDGQLYGLSKADGSVVFSFQTHRYAIEMDGPGSEHYGIHGTAAFDQECAYIGDYSGYLYAIYKDTGRLKWEKKLGGSIGASPVLYNGYIFIAVEYPEPNGRVFVLESSDGSEVYATDYLGHHPHSSVSIDASQGYMFVGANNGFFYCFDFVNQKEIFRVKTFGPIKSTAALVGDTAYVTSWDKRLYAIGIDSGEVRFTFSARDIIISSPSYYHNRLYFGSHDGYVYCIDAEQGFLIWSFKTQGSVFSSPTIVQQAGVVVVGSKDSYLYMLDLDDGELRWSVGLDAPVSSVPVAVGDALYVNDDSGTVWRFLNSSHEYSN